MGWTSCDSWTTKKAIREDILADHKTIVAHKASKSGLWAVLPDGSDGQLVLVLFLIQRRGKVYGYKDMSENMHPFFYDCPAELVAMAPAPGRPSWDANGPTWREVWAGKQGR